MNPYDELRLVAAELYEHETRAGGICPFCRGGRTGEGSLSITKLPSGAAVFVCHRAACDKRGRIGESWTAVDGATDRPKPKEFEPRIYDAGGNVDVYESHEALLWLGRFGIEAGASEGIRQAPCRWDSQNRRTVWEVRSSFGTLRGYELRAYRDQDRPKTIHYRHTAEPWIGWFGVCTAPGVVVAVEDVISAYKVSLAGLQACSLMGTNLNIDKLCDMLSVSDNIVLALDRDATDKSITYQKKYALIAPDLKVLSLSRDLKYEEPNTITTMISEVCDG